MRRRVAVVLALVCALSFTASAAAAGPAISLSAYGARPGATITVTGSGFADNTAVDVFIDESNTAIATSSSSGAVSIAVTIPLSTQPGYHYVTLDAEGTHVSAQAQVNVYAAWQQGAYGASWLGFNPYENTLSPSNVGQLAETWSTQVTIYGNPKPFVVSGNNIYLYDEEGGIHAYTTAGKLLWTATPGASFEFTQADPSAPGSLVYFGDSAGQVFAYNYLCRTDGGSCTPQWTASIGNTQVIGGISARGNLLYIPGADGLIHVLNASTGAVGTSLTPTASGALSSAVAFDTAGDAFVAQGSSFEELRAGGGGSDQTYSSGTSVSRPAVSNDAAYYTTSTGYLNDYGGGWTDVSLGGTTGCDTPPVVADNVVYAAGCTTLGAWDAGTGTQLWSITIPAESQGLAIANGVLYGCIGDRLEAYAASYGGSLWSGGNCSGAPEIVNGAVYASSDRLEASTLSGGFTASMRRSQADRPNPRTLRTNRRLQLKWRRNHAGRMHHQGAGRSQSHT